MKKLLFPFMFLLGILLFSACNEEDPRDNLPQFGDNRLEWLQNGAEFIYAINGGDSILIRYDLVRPGSNVFQKTFIYFSAGDNITDPAVMASLSEFALTSFVQPGINFQQASLWESNNINMQPREEIYKFDEGFTGRNWTFTTHRISEQDWATSTTPGLKSILNTRTISLNNWPVFIRNANDSIIATIPCSQIDLTSRFSNANGGGSIMSYSSFFVNKDYGLVKANEGGLEYTLARRSVNTVVLPTPPPPGPTPSYDDFIKAKVNGVNYNAWAAAATSDGGLGVRISISGISFNNEPFIMISFPYNTTAGTTYTITGDLFNDAASAFYNTAAGMGNATSGTITITSFANNVVKGTFEFVVGTFTITEGEFSAELP